MLAEARQFEAYSRLTAFLMHDLKNLLAQQELIVSNAKKHKRNPAFVDNAIDTIGKSVQRVRRVIEQLQQRSDSLWTERIELGKEILNAVSRCADRQPLPTARAGGRQSRLSENVCSSRLIAQKVPRGWVSVLISFERLYAPWAARLASTVGLPKEHE